MRLLVGSYTNDRPLLVKFWSQKMTHHLCSLRSFFWLYNKLDLVPIQAQQPTLVRPSRPLAQAPTRRPRGWFDSCVTGWCLQYRFGNFARVHGFHRSVGPQICGHCVLAIKWICRRVIVPGLEIVETSTLQGNCNPWKGHSFCFAQPHSSDIAVRQ